MIPTGPKPAWVQEIEDARGLLARYVQSHGPVQPGAEVFLTIGGVAYVALASGASAHGPGPSTYIVIGPNGETTITTPAPLTEPDEFASDAEWDAYLQARPALEAAIRAAGI